MPTGTRSDAFPAQRGQKRTRSRQTIVEPGRSRSNTAASKLGRPPRSRGSTASIQSCSTQYLPEQQQVPDGYEPYLRSQFAPSQPAYHGNPEEMIMRFGDQLANSTNGAVLDPALQENHNSVKPRMDIHYQHHDIHGHNISAHGLPTELAQHGITGDIHSTHYPGLFEGVENQIPEHILDGNDGSEQGPRKKRGTSSSIANDNELRRLLRQYDGYTLQQMAAEVQKHEGAGGKSEKVKQVFAMVWYDIPLEKSSILRFNQCPGFGKTAKRAMALFVEIVYIAAMLKSVERNAFLYLTLHLLESSSESYFRMCKLDGLE
ncbi:hypothetical protein LOZ66_000700 [Ophidiomyces ophidiicola]|nr:hypothetical protein LOZ66_000700 [Ophidiomyces ophidiicola]